VPTRADIGPNRCLQPCQWVPWHGLRMHETPINIGLARLARFVSALRRGAGGEKASLRGMPNSNSLAPEAPWSHSPASDCGLTHSSIPTVWICFGFRASDFGFTFPGFCPAMILSFPPRRAAEPPGQLPSALRSGVQPYTHRTGNSTASTSRIINVYEGPYNSTGDSPISINLKTCQSTGRR
jgi:hypothetical protein